MEEKLLNYFQEIMPLSTEEIKAICETLNIKEYKKGAVILEEGQISMEAYFVLEGCVRQFYLVDGDEKTNNFFTDGQWVVSMQSFGQKVPSQHYLDCATDCKLVVGNRELEEDLYKRYPKFETISRKVMEKVFAEQQELFATFTTLTPEQRYAHLLEKRPYLFEKIPQYQIASFIGVKPESLSRIRKRILFR